MATTQEKRLTEEAAGKATLAHEAAKRVHAAAQKTCSALHRAYEAHQISQADWLALGKIADEALVAAARAVDAAYWAKEAAAAANWETIRDEVR